jgi:hypothetical protein
VVATDSWPDHLLHRGDVGSSIEQVAHPRTAAVVELATEEAGGEDVIGMPVETWRAVRAHSWLLLDLVENGGAQAVMRYLDSRGLEWFLAHPHRPSRQPGARALASPRGGIGDRTRGSGRHVSGPGDLGPGQCMGEESGLTSETSVMVWHEAGHVVAYLVHGQSSARDDPGR